MLVTPLITDMYYNYRVLPNIITALCFSLHSWLIIFKCSYKEFVHQIQRDKIASVSPKYSVNNYLLSVVIICKRL